MSTALTMEAIVSMYRKMRAIANVSNHKIHVPAYIKEALFPNQDSIEIDGFVLSVIIDENIPEYIMENGEIETSIYILNESLSGEQ